MSTPPALIAAARRRRRRPGAGASNWITDASAPIAWGEGDALQQWSDRINQPVHDRLLRTVGNGAEIARGADDG